MLKRSGARCSPWSSCLERTDQLNEWLQRCCHVQGFEYCDHSHTFDRPGMLALDGMQLTRRGKNILGCNLVGLIARDLIWWGKGMYCCVTEKSHGKLTLGSNEEKPPIYTRGIWERSSKKVTWQIAQLKSLYTNAHSMENKQEEIEIVVQLVNYDINIVGWIT